MKNRRRSGRRFTEQVSIGLMVAGALLGLCVYLGVPARALRAPKVPRLPGNVTLPFTPPPPLPPTALYQGTQVAAILMYHDVTPDASVYFDVKPDEFRKQLTQLKDAGANFVPLAAIYDHYHNGKELPEKAVAITFDDGYAGQYENAYPVLKEMSCPATFFVHTGAVGLKTGRAHITWDQLKALDKEGLVSVECHTVTHPEDLRKCDDAQLQKELNDSKKTLEEKLGRKIRFLAYPVGNADGRVAKVAHEAGYEMALTMGPDWARPPADALFVPRFLPKYVPDICSQLSNANPTTNIDAAVLEVKPAEIESDELEDGQVHMKYVRGGRVSGVRLMGRRTVPAIVKATGGVGGLNGTFFSDARVNSAGAGIVGPIMSRLGPPFAPGLPGDRSRISGRPLVLISQDQIAFLPFEPGHALDADGVERLLPGARDCFLAGAWLVHKGIALTHDELEQFNLSNIFDFRPRAFFGVDDQGRVFLGASSTGNMSDRIGESLVKLGLKEAVLLDSGFSTSLVYKDEVLVSGIRRADMPARPIPHALVLYPVDPKTGKEVLAPIDLPEVAAAPPPDPAADPALGNAPDASNAPGNGPSPAPPTRPTTVEQLQEYFATGFGVPDEHAPQVPAGGRRGRKHRRH